MLHRMMLTVASLTLAATFGAAGTLEKTGPRRFDLEPYGAKTIVEEFEANRRASAVVVGIGVQAARYMGPYMAVYVFDERGNCVAWDDEGDPSVRDDLAVEWHPPQQGRCAMQVFNQGHYGNKFVIAVR